VGEARAVRAYSVGTPGATRAAGVELSRSRPRAFAEWQALRRWGRLPTWERGVPGYLLRTAREEAGLTQKGLAARLGTTQQAVAQAERWGANPTIVFMGRWAAACGASLEVRLSRIGGSPPRRQR
jgi:DNA-binding XRE family transcriptional regulator